VKCQNYNGNDNDFDNALKALTNFEIDELVISGYNSYRLPERTFILMDGSPRSLIKKISIINSPNLIYLGNVNSNYTFFDGLGLSLETLHIEKCNGIRDDEWIRFSKSLTTESVLKTLIFYNNNLFIRSFDNFNDLPGIQSIYMRNNQLNGISADLTKLTNLKVLDLSSNQLTNFELKGRSETLTTIYLRKNNIQYIKQSILDVLGNLMLIDLTGESIQSNS